MTTRNLEYLFHPASIVLIGASDRPHAVGHVVASNLVAAGFTGRLMGVNPHLPQLAGLEIFPDIAALPVTPELAVICTPAPTVPELISELAGRGTKAAIVISAGFSGTNGHALRQQMLEAAQPQLLRIVGPNCVGVLSTGAGVNASFAHLPARPGRIAMVTQSGAILTTVLDWASARGIGFSHLVSMGDMADADFGDMLDYLAGDSGTDAIILYVEAVTQARKFMSASRAAARLKPVIAIKAGRHPAAAKAALSHTGALAGADAVYDAAFRRAGILRVKTLDEIFDAIGTLGTGYVPRGERLAILTNGGGAGVLATDALLDEDGTLAELAPATLAKLDAVLPPTWSHGNPVDIIGDAPPERYTRALEVLLAAEEVGNVLVMNCPTAVASSTDAAHAVIDASAALRKPVLTNWLGAVAAQEARALFAAARLPTYETPDEAIRGFMDLVRHRRAQAALMEVPPSLQHDGPPDRVRAAEIVGAAAQRGGGWLAAPEIAELLACYRIPAARCVIAGTPDEAADAAAQIGGRIALKIVSPDILHKSDSGGVALDLEGADSVRDAARAMQHRISADLPTARLEGFLVQEMIVRPGAHELILGMTVDPTFGPMLLFGRGGIAVEVVADTVLAMPPLNLVLARAAMERTRVIRELRGYRNRKPADLDAVAECLVRLAQLVGDLDAVVELDINPLLADETGVIAVDARIRVEAAQDPHRQRLAILPYPSEYEYGETSATLGRLLIRPVRPEDAPAFIAFFGKLTPEDIHMRFFSVWRSIPQQQLARLTQIDYDREMAFVLQAPSTGELIAIARLAADPNNERAEFAVIVRSDLKGQGYGTMLMKRLLQFARERGIGEAFGDILVENKAMLAFSRDLGFSLEAVPGAANLVRARLKLV